jgi:hypothetical protein
MRHAEIDEPGLLVAAHHLERHTHDAFGDRGERRAVGSLAQRVGARHVDVLPRQRRQPLRKPRETRLAARHGRRMQTAVAEAAKQLHLLLDPLHRLQHVARAPRQQQVKAVRPEVQRGSQIGHEAALAD